MRKAKDATLIESMMSALLLVVYRPNSFLEIKFHPPRGKQIPIDTKINLLQLIEQDKSTHPYRL